MPRGRHCKKMHLKAEEGLSGLNLKGLRALKQKSVGWLEGVGVIGGDPTAQWRELNEQKKCNLVDTLRQDRDTSHIMHA